MKKVFSIMIVVLMMMFSSCSLIFGSSYNSGNSYSEKPEEKVKVTLTLVNALSNKDIVATCGEKLTVSQPIKSGYYFTGYYDSEVGGVCYIDGLGNSNSLWQEEYPTTLYAHWESISGMSYDSEVDYVDKASEFRFYSQTFFYELPNEFKNAINGNLNESLNLIVHFKAKETPTGVLESYAPLTIKVQDSDDNGALTLAKYKFTPSNEYQSHDLNFSVKAGDFRKGIVYVVFDLGYANTRLYLRNVSISISFN